jgi:outer membrane immunogenic protein
MGAPSTDRIERFSQNEANEEAGAVEMKRILLGAIALLAWGAVAPAVAADLPARAYTKAPEMMMPAIYDWSGFYVGFNGGGAWSHECYAINSVAGVAVAPNSEGCHNATGGLVGGQVGYRWQMSSWIFGFDAQGDWASLKGSNSSLTAITPYANQTKVDAIGLFTGQVGYAWNNVLWYAKGGAAVTDNQYSSFFTSTNIQFNAASDTRWGGAIGTGIEISFAPNWSVALEYDHLFMGNPNITFPTSANAVTRSDNIKQDVDIGSVRVNYRWGGPVVAKY